MDRSAKDGRLHANKKKLCFNHVDETALKTLVFDFLKIDVCVFTKCFNHTSAQTGIIDHPCTSRTHAKWTEN